ncbi:hypothetical protein [Clostridium sp. D53t1_180928_C8]|uniref:hypothetical protein n=1 Tax=Clostridium sp. D53t1_180928_C8 TaxID=2787101 RepID=UPI0018AAC548|nr:hypothetical protein [Clostridium sp. D53t1_180928_C8]
MLNSISVTLINEVNQEISSDIDVLNIKGEGYGKIYLEDRNSDLTINMSNVKLGTDEKGGYLDLSGGMQGHITINAIGENIINAGMVNLNYVPANDVEVNAAIRISKGVITTIICGEGNSLTCIGETLVYKEGVTPEYKAGAGIGGSSGDTCGTIIVNCEGKITAIGGVSAAGIGGGSGGDGNNITINIINGGTVEAIASYDVNGNGGAGIGGGCGYLNSKINNFEGGNSGTITINAQGKGESLANIISIGGHCGAGIGGGAYGNGSGSIIQVSCEGCKDSGKEIEISKGEGITINLNGNSKIQASSLYGAAGIGGGAGLLPKDESSDVFIGGNGGVINIMGTSSDSIIAIGGIQGAGIGGGSNGNGGNITIGGELFINAQGGNNAAGIGGGYALEYFGINCICGNGGIIEINGQVNIDTSGSYGGAGIGGGFNGKSGQIIINNCNEINATGGYGGAGIGGGLHGQAQCIEVKSGNVINAIGGVGIIETIDNDGNRITQYCGGGAGVGDGTFGYNTTAVKYGDNAEIDIAGVNNLTASGGSYGGAGIGGGSECSSGKIVINNCNYINATGGNAAAGIGGGNRGNSIDIKINNVNNIIASGGEESVEDSIYGGAGIGGGGFGNNIAIKVSGCSKLSAIGSGGGAGIGGGAGNSGDDNDEGNILGGYAGNIDLNDCQWILANGSSEFINGFNRGSSGIGGGAFGNGGYINSSNCDSITAIGGLFGGSGIGGGYTGCYHNIEIVGFEILEAKGNSEAQNIGVGDNCPIECLNLVKSSKKKPIIRQRIKINRGINLFKVSKI